MPQLRASNVIKHLHKRHPRGLLPPISAGDFLVEPRSHDELARSFARRGEV
jgi:hypothetical protein